MTISTAETIQYQWCINDYEAQGGIKQSRQNRSTKRKTFHKYQVKK